MKKVLFNVELNEHNKHRRDHLVNQLKKYVNLSECKFLEVGIGNGRFGFLLGNRVKRYYGIDIDQEYVKLARKNIPKNADVEYKVGKAEEIPFNEKFDVILYGLSWHFIKDFGKAIYEANRVY